MDPCGGLVPSRKPGLHRAASGHGHLPQHQFAVLRDNPLAIGEPQRSSPLERIGNPQRQLDLSGNLGRETASRRTRGGRTREEVSERDRNLRDPFASGGGASAAGSIAVPLPDSWKAT